MFFGPVLEADKVRTVPDNYVDCHGVERSHHWQHSQMNGLPLSNPSWWGTKPSLRGTVKGTECHSPTRHGGERSHHFAGPSNERNASLLPVLAGNEATTAQDNQMNGMPFR